MNLEPLLFRNEKIIQQLHLQKKSESPDNEIFGCFKETFFFNSGSGKGGAERSVKIWNIQVIDPT